MQEGTEIIGEQAFYECTSLSEINLPDTINSVGKFSMVNSKITKLDVPASLKTIGPYAFFCLEELQTVNIPEGVETIRYYALIVAKIRNK